MTTTPTAATNPADTVDDGRDAVIEQAIAHTCFDGDDFDGTLTDGCAGCEQARCYPCGYCGYGRTFPTHNAQAHQDGCDPMAPANLADVSEAWANSPHRRQHRRGERRTVGARADVLHAHAAPDG